MSAPVPDAPRPPPIRAWHERPAAEVAGEFHTDLEKGLSPDALPPLAPEEVGVPWATASRCRQGSAGLGRSGRRQTLRA